MKKDFSQVHVPGRWGGIGLLYDGQLYQPLWVEDRIGQGGKVTMVYVCGAHCFSCRTVFRVYVRLLSPSGPSRRCAACSRIGYYVAKEMAAKRRRALRQGLTPAKPSAPPAPLPPQTFDARVWFLEAAQRRWLEEHCLD